MLLGSGFLVGYTSRERISLFLFLGHGEVDQQCSEVRRGDRYEIDLDTSPVCGKCTSTASVPIAASDMPSKSRTGLSTKRGSTQTPTSPSMLSGLRLCCGVVYMNEFTVPFRVADDVVAYRSWLCNLA